MRVLVTGANGSVGSAVVARLLADGHDVHALVRRGAEPARAELFHGDITDAAVLREAARGVELAVHCAASVSSNLAECRHVNVDGVRCLVEALVAAGRPRLVHVSTVSVYDDDAGPDYDEDSALCASPALPYAFTKAEAERILREDGRLPAVVLRPPVILSMHPRSRWGPLAVARARVEPDCLVPFSELPYVHVENLVEAIVLSAWATGAPGRAYNVVEGVADTREYLAAVYGAAGRTPPAVPAGAPRLRFAAMRARRELAWAPQDRWRRFLDELRTA